MLSLPETARPHRIEIEAPVVAHTRIVHNEFEIVFHAPPIAQTAQPGQFVELLFGDNYAPLMRRPFSLYRVDRAEGTFSILYLARGSFTSGLAQKRIGDRVSLLGPLGRPFSWSGQPGTRHLLIAGGIGAPPIYFLAREICRECRVIPTPRSRGNASKETLQNSIQSEIIVINGARSEELLVGMGEFGALDIVLHALTEDGSHGRRGLTTAQLQIELERDVETAKPTQIYACGPMPMLRSIGEIALAQGIDCQLSIETAMPCGIGICNGCAIPIADPEAPEGFTYARACWDGPVFEARDLIWARM